MSVTVRINKVIEATANDDGTWTCSDATMQSYLNIVAGKDAMKDRLYIPYKAPYMAFMLERMLPAGDVEIIKRDAISPAPEGTIF